MSSIGPFTPDDIAIARAWLNWRNQHAQVVVSEADLKLGEPFDDESLVLLGHLIQACAEHQDEFLRATAPVYERVTWFHANPLTYNCLHELNNIIRNGCYDDWMLVLKWTDSGYQLAPEPQTPGPIADQHLSPYQLTRLLDLITGGRRMPSTDTDEHTARLIQQMYEVEQPLAHRPKG